MGDRGNVKFTSPYNSAPIYFYTHWMGTELPAIVAQALHRGKGRWNDDSYLARIIFSEMIVGEVLEDTGYGISTRIVDNEHGIIHVQAGGHNAGEGRVVFEDREGNPAKEDQYYDGEHGSFTFTEFIKRFHPDAQETTESEESPALTI